MIFFKNFLFYLGVIPVTFFLTLFGWCLFFTPFSVRYWIITRWSHFFIFWAKTICGISYTVEGLENIPEGNAIVFSNHQSMWETIFFQVILPPQSWILKKELIQIPVFGWGLALIEPIAIDRRKSNSIKELIRLGKKCLKSGRFVIIFPEGTRVNPGENKRFTRSGAALAHASEYPVLPIAHDAGRLWPRGFLIRKAGTIHVKIGPLIETKGKGTDEINHEAEKWINEALASL